MSVTPFYLRGNSGALVTLLRPELKAVLNRAAIIGYDVSVITSYRDPVAQMAAYKAGKSKAKPGQSPHNFKPSFAFDFVPRGFKDWNNIQQFRTGAHVFMTAAHIEGVEITWGGDWNRNGIETDEHGLRDFDHIELAFWRTLVKGKGK